MCVFDLGFCVRSVFVFFGAILGKCLLQRDRVHMREDLVCLC